MVSGFRPGRRGPVSHVTRVQACKRIRLNLHSSLSAKVFIDVRVFNPNANWELGKEYCQIYKSHEEEKNKQGYLPRVLQVEKGTLPRQYLITCVIAMRGYKKPTTTAAVNKVFSGKQSFLFLPLQVQSFAKIDTLDLDLRKTALTASFC